MASIAVTGALGFIGSHLVSGLLHTTDAWIHAYDFVQLTSPLGDQKSLKMGRLSQLLDLPSSRRLIFHNVDLGSAGSLSSLPLGPLIIYHLAALPGLSAIASARDYHVANVDMTTNIIKQLSPDTRFIYVSTSSVYGSVAVADESSKVHPCSEYGRTKWEAERLVKDSGLAYCIIRPFSIYGPGERPDKLLPVVFDHLEKNLPVPIYQGSLDHERSFTHVYDFRDALLTLIESDNRWERAKQQVINIGDHKSYTIRQILDMIPVDTVPIRTLQTRRQGDQTRTRAVVEKARVLLNWNSRIDLKDGVALAYQAHCQRRLL